MYHGITEHQYNGSLVRQETVSLTFHCYFELNLFPFGLHPCRFSLSIADKGNMAPVFRKNVCVEAQYSSNKNNFILIS